MSKQPSENINASQINPDTGFLDPANIRLISAPPIDPADDPLFDPNFFNLTNDEDIVSLAPRILRSTPGGLIALAGNDFVKGSDEPELINGNAGEDTLVGSGGDDTLRGGIDFDQLYGGTGNDILNGNKEDDYIIGNEGNDVLRGGKGNDNLVGEEDNDTLIGDGGIDKLWGGAGEDIFVLSKDSAVPNQEVGSLQPRSNNDQFIIDPVIADFILDFTPGSGDAIGLTGGMTQDDIVVTERFLTIGDRRDFDSRGPFPLGIPRTADFQTENIKVSVIREISTGNILGMVKNISPEQLKFVSISDRTLGLG
ncbi:calcium-binding protein [Kamptonema animale CS-326]|jgi:serralysin|uniref:calcium-binding protein n=1 Tax=Kamptonema animale TaxID=92934 RepID=UPI00232F5974|nr:calcium-binding protein [Kamptonema animale]MDB9510342.1 calcium-binding protein [Kamptonema animale CS-326]